jgi:hypothetical protein
MREDSRTYRTFDDETLAPSEIARLDPVEARLQDAGDIAETSDAAWATAVRGRPAKAMEAAISVRLDAEALAWVRERAGRQRRDQSHPA